MPAVDMARKNWVAGEWYTAVLSLCREWTRISAIISVTVGEASVDVFDEDKVDVYLYSTESRVKSTA